MRTKSVACVLTTIMVLTVTSACRAAEVDLHHAWEDRCGDCHAHAAALARKLRLVDGQLVRSRNDEDLRAFLRNHYLQDDRVDAVYDMLLAQATTEAKFQTDCATCHGTAAAFARNSLEYRNDTLHGRNTGRPVRDVLDGHQHLTSQDAEFFTDLLQRVAREVGLR